MISRFSPFFAISVFPHLLLLRSLAVAFQEFLHATGRIHQFLLPCKEGVTIGANVHVEFRFRGEYFRNRLIRRTSTVHLAGNIFRVDSGFHGYYYGANSPVRSRGWSGRPDLNRRPLAPQASALTRLRHAPQEKPPESIPQSPVPIPLGNKKPPCPPESQPFKQGKKARK
jgi:hypothetical protein